MSAMPILIWDCQNQVVEASAYQREVSYPFANDVGTTCLLPRVRIYRIRIAVCVVQVQGLFKILPAIIGSWHNISDSSALKPTKYAKPCYKSVWVIDIEHFKLIEQEDSV